MRFATARPRRLATSVLAAALAIVAIGAGRAAGSSEPADPDAPTAGGVVELKTSDPPAAPGMAASSLAVDAVTPAQGVPDVDVGLTITGSGFEPGTRVSLLQGGPYVAATIPVSDPSSMVLHGHVLYAGADAGVIAVDVTDPSAPVVVGPIITSTPWPSEMALAGDDVLYVTTYRSLSVFDATDPLHPVRRATLPLPGFSHRMIADGKRLYIAQGVDGLAVFDIANPYAPYLVGTLPCIARDLARLDASHVLVAPAGTPRAILVVDVAAYPTVIGSLPSVTTGTLVVTALPPDGRAAAPNEHAAVIDGQILRLVNLGNPAAPVVTREVSLARYLEAESVEVAGSRIVARATYDGLLVVDAREGAAPSTFNLRTFGGSTQLLPADGIAYVGDSDLGIRVVDLSVPDRLSSDGELLLAGSAYDLYPVGSQLHVAASDRLAVADLSVPSAPVLLGETPSAPLTHSIVSVGAYDYLLNQGYLMSFDVADVAAPRLTNSVRVFWLPQGMATDGQWLYLPDHYQFRIHSATPALNALGTTATVGQGRATACSPGVCYFGGELFPRGTIEIIDVRNVMRPVHRGGLYMPGPVQGVAYADGLVYVTGRLPTDDDGLGYLRICDLTYPTSPFCLSHLEFRGAGTDVRIADQTAYVSNGEGVVEIDVALPTRPILRARRRLPGYNRRIALLGDHVATAAGWAGIQVVRPGPSLPAPAVVSSTRLEAVAPAGLAEGAYDLLVTAPDGTTAVLPNAYRACGTHGLRLVLDPMIAPGAREITPPVRWQLRIEGDDALLARPEAESAGLQVPPAAALVEPALVQADGPDTIEVVLAGETARVVLTGRDPAALAQAWAGWSGEGRLPLRHNMLPGSARHTYGDVIVRRAGGWIAPTARSFTYTLGDGGVTEVRLGGTASHLVFAAELRTGLGCRYTPSVDLATRIEELCRATGTPGVLCTPGP